eukprot:SAG22_NODE_2591_length_2407_cov_3.973137_1_plen_430_part_00
MARAGRELHQGKMWALLWLQLASGARPLPPGPRAAREPALPPPVKVFVEGEHGIACWRIPAVIDVTRRRRRPSAQTEGVHHHQPQQQQQPQQQLLAFAEARISACSDDTLKMMAMKRSSDGGASWSAPVFIVGDNATRTSPRNSVWNPEPVYDAEHDTVVLSYLRNRTNCLARPGHCQAFQIASTDSGRSFGPAAPLAPALGKFANGIRPGPGAGLVLDVGPKKGRILFSGSYDQIPKAPGEQVVDLVWWSSGDRGSLHNYTLSPSRIGGGRGDESALVQLANGSVLLSMRTVGWAKGPAACRCRAVSRSDDFGESFGPSVLAPDLIQPGPSGCQGAMVRPPGQDMLFYSGPASTVDRHNMTVKRSSDGGATFPDAVVVHAGPSSYSSLTALHGAEELGLLFEHPTTTSGKGAEAAVGALSFVRVPMGF